MMLQIILCAWAVGGTPGVRPGLSVPNDDYWTAWRARQRAELATLPKAPDPPPGAGSAIDSFPERLFREEGAEFPSTRR